MNSNERGILLVIADASGYARQSRNSLHDAGRSLAGVAAGYVAERDAYGQAGAAWATARKSHVHPGSPN